MQSPLTTDRGKLRMEKLRQLELEQLQWEQEALVMPEVRLPLFIPRLLTRLWPGPQPRALALLRVCQNRIQRP